MMVKAVLLDCGGVMVAPTTGNWALGPGFEEVLGEGFYAAHGELFQAARQKYLQLLPDANRVDTDEKEYAMFIAYYRAVFAEMGFSLSEGEIERLAYLQTYRDDRYVFFGDLHAHLAAWRGTYKLGIVSDAPPSTRRVMEAVGVMAYMDGATFSCDIGVLKPDPRIYRSTLDQLGVGPRDAVFVDDDPSRLYGAEAIGVRGIQMIRTMPERFAMPPVWEGPVVRSFYELDVLLRGL